MSEDSGRWREQQPAPATATTTAPAELAELLPGWLDAEAQRRIWQGCRQFATDCTLEEVAAAVQDKMRVLGKKTNPGLVIISVPKMFEGSRGFHHRFRQHAHQQAAERQRQQLERIANDEGESEESRRWARQMLGDAGQVNGTAGEAAVQPRPPQSELGSPRESSPAAGGAR